MAKQIARAGTQNMMLRNFPKSILPLIEAKKKELTKLSPGRAAVTNTEAIVKLIEGK